MTVHVDKVKPFLGKVPKSWLAASQAPKSESSLRELITKRHWSRRSMTNPMTSSMLSPNLKERAFQESTMKSMELDHWKDQDARSNNLVFPYSLPSVGPGADPGVQAVSPQVT